MHPLARRHLQGHRAAGEVAGEALTCSRIMAFDGRQLEVGARVRLGDRVACLRRDIGEGLGLAAAEGEIPAAVQRLAEAEAAGYTRRNHHFLDSHRVFLAVGEGACHRLAILQIDAGGAVRHIYRRVGVIAGDAAQFVAASRGACSVTV